MGFALFNPCQPCCKHIHRGCPCDLDSTPDGILLGIGVNPSIPIGLDTIQTILRYDSTTGIWTGQLRYLDNNQSFVTMTAYFYCNGTDDVVEIYDSNNKLFSSTKMSIVALPICVDECNPLFMQGSNAAVLPNMPPNLVLVYIKPIYGYMINECTDTNNYISNSYPYKLPPYYFTDAFNFMHLPYYGSVDNILFWDNKCQWHDISTGFIGLYAVIILNTMYHGNDGYWYFVQRIYWLEYAWIAGTYTIDIVSGIDNGLTSINGSLCPIVTFAPYPSQDLLATIIASCPDSDFNPQTMSKFTVKSYNLTNMYIGIYPTKIMYSPNNFNYVDIVGSPIYIYPYSQKLCGTPMNNTWVGNISCNDNISYFCPSPQHRALLHATIHSNNPALDGLVIPLWFSYYGGNIGVGNTSYIHTLNLAGNPVLNYTGRTQITVGGKAYLIDVGCSCPNKSPYSSPPTTMNCTIYITCVSPTYTLLLNSNCRCIPTLACVCPSPDSWQCNPLYITFNAQNWFSVLGSMGSCTGDPFASLSTNMEVIITT